MESVNGFTVMELVLACASMGLICFLACYIINAIKGVGDG